MANVTNRTVSINITEQGAKSTAQSIEALKGEIQKATDELQRLGTTSADVARKKVLEKSINNKTKTLGTLQQKLADVDRVMKNLSGSTYNDLLSVQKQLNKDLKKLVPNTDEYRQTLQKLKDVTSQLSERQKELSDDMGESQNIFQKAAATVNKYFFSLYTLKNMFSSLQGATQEYVQAFADMEDAQAQVRKYTGMTADEVAELNEDLKQMDTRTSREQLNALAGDAGRLGITAKDAVLEFVNAADVISVALGDDLGDGAVQQIGKLAQMFGEDKTKGLRGAMFATGSAVNELAQTSSAGADYMVDFTARVAGVAKQAGMSQADILGFASVLDQNMQQVETSATVFSQLMTKMYQDPAKFAALAGKDVQEFTTLLKTDANSAMKAFLAAMQDKGGFADLAPMFEGMNLNGTRAVGVLSTLAAKLGDVETAQRTANTAYSEGVSVVNEFNVQNTTVQAELDKQQKRLEDLRIELGERLLPVYTATADGALAMMSAMAAMVSFAASHITTIATLATSITALAVAQNAAAIKAQLLTLWSGKLKKALTGLWTVVTRHPLAALGVAAATVVAYLVDMYRNAQQANGGMLAMKSVADKTADSFDGQAATVDRLNATLHDSAAAIDQRRAALARLQEIVPDYNASLTDEGVLINDNTDALKDYLTQLEREIRLKAAQEELEEQYRKKRQMERQQTEAQQRLASARGAAQSASASVNPMTGGRDTGSYAAVFKAESDLNAATAGLRQATEAIAALEKEVSQGSIAVRIEGTTSGGSTSANSQHPTSTTPQASSAASSGTISQSEIDAAINNIRFGTRLSATEEAIERENELYAQQQLELQQIYVAGQDAQLLTQEEYAQRKQELELEHLNRILEIAGLEADKRKKIEQQMLDYRQKVIEEARKAEKAAAAEGIQTEQERTQKYQQLASKNQQTVLGYASSFGAAMGQVIGAEEDALQAFGDTMIDVLFDILQQLIETQLLELAATSVTESGKATAKQIGSKGFAGIGTGAILAGIITAGIAAAKVALKSLIGKKRDTGTTSTTSSSQTTQTYARVSQYASGNYSVLGAEDGRLYNAPYIGAAPTGVVTSPALISENGAELIVNADDLQRLRRHLNWPVILDTLNEVRQSGATAAVAQHASGSYSAASTPNTQHPAASTTEVLSRLSDALAAIERNGIRAGVSLTEIDRKQKLRERSRKIGSKR